MHTHHNADTTARGVHFLPIYYKKAFVLLLPVPLFAFGFQCSIPTNAENTSTVPMRSNCHSEPSHKLRAVVLYNAAQGKVISLVDRVFNWLPQPS